MNMSAYYHIYVARKKSNHEKKRHTDASSCPCFAGFLRRNARRPAAWTPRCVDGIRDTCAGYCWRCTASRCFNYTKRTLIEKWPAHCDRPLALCDSARAPRGGHLSGNRCVFFRETHGPDGSFAVPPKRSPFPFPSSGTLTWALVRCYARLSHTQRAAKILIWASNAVVVRSDDAAREAGSKLWE